MTDLTFEVPGEPQGKGRARAVRIGGFTRLATPAKTVAYEGLIAHAAAAAMGSRPPIEAACEISVVAYFGVPASWSKVKQQRAIDGVIRPAKKPDGDNILKAVADGLNGVAWRDDAQAVEASISKRYSARPGLIVTVRPIGGVCA